MDREGLFDEVTERGPLWFMNRQRGPLWLGNRQRTTLTWLVDRWREDHSVQLCQWIAFMNMFHSFSVAVSRYLLGELSSLLWLFAHLECWLASLVFLSAFANLTLLISLSISLSLSPFSHLSLSPPLSLSLSCSLRMCCELWSLFWQWQDQSLGVSSSAG